MTVRVLLGATNRKARIDIATAYVKLVCIHIDT